MKKEKINSQCFQVTISLLRAFVSFTLVESNNNSSSNNNANIVDVDNDYDDDDVPTQKKEQAHRTHFLVLLDTKGKIFSFGFAMCEPIRIIRFALYSLSPSLSPYTHTVCLYHICSISS